MKTCLHIFSIYLLCWGNSGDYKIEITNNTVTQKQNIEMHLLDHVKLAINPKFEDWVLFENGTYIIFDHADTIADLKTDAIKLMKEYGPVHTGSPAGDLNVIHLNKTEGWVVSGHCYGMYTYVNPKELSTGALSDVDIGFFGRSKREKDGIQPVVIHVNRKK